jgi:hypothetical protein
MTRSHNDWAALRKAELEGREKPGTYDRLWREHEERLAAEATKKMEAEFAKATQLHREAMGPKT